jgi:hypothetical protein
METKDCPAVQRSNLCLRCKGIDLDYVFNKRRLKKSYQNTYSERWGYGFFVIDLEASVASLNNSECLLCRLFGSVAFEDPRLRPGTPKESATCHLIAHSGHQTFGPETFGPENLHALKRDVTLICVIATTRPRYIHPTSYAIHLTVGSLCLISSHRSSQELSVHPIGSELFNVGFAKNCMTRCRHHHQSICNSRSMEAMTFFRLIDCQSRKVITAPQNCEYAALSYVWGAPVLAHTVDCSDN